MNSLLVVSAVVGFLVSLTAVAATLVSLGRVLQRLDELAKIAAKIEEWVEELRKHSTDLASAHQLTQAEAEQHGGRVTVLERRSAELSELIHQLIRDITVPLADMKRLGAELVQLIQRSHQHDADMQGLALGIKHIESDLNDLRRRTGHPSTMGMPAAPKNR